MYMSRKLTCRQVKPQTAEDGFDGQCQVYNFVTLIRAKIDAQHYRIIRRPASLRS
jgi:hypothetical protein